MFVPFQFRCKPTHVAVSCSANIDILLHITQSQWCLQNGQMPAKKYLSKRCKIFDVRLTILWTLGMTGWKLRQVDLSRFLGQNKILRVPVAIYLLKVNNRNTRTRCKICSNLTKKTPRRFQWRRSSVFIVNFEQISHICSGVSIADFEQVNASCDTFQNYKLASILNRF